LTHNGKQGNVTDLRSRRGYAPDLVGLACSKVASARQQSGLSAEEFAAELGQQLGWIPSLDVLGKWETTVDAPSHIVIACEIIASRTVGAAADASADEVAAAASDAGAEQAWLLAEPGPQSVESLCDEAAGIARAGNRSARQAFGASRRLHGQALQLIGHTHSPAALSDLYAIAGQTAALMASTAFDLNRWDESATLAQSAVSYATLVGHSSLQAWTLGLAALLANWRDESDTALAHIGRGLLVAPAGTPRARLRYIAARSHALLGDAASVSDVLDQARHDQDDAGQHADVLCEEIGGEFAFGRARADACAAAAWLDLGCGQEAKQAAHRALSDLATLPTSRQPVSQVTGARIDLATACLVGGDRDEAEEALGHVFAVPSPLRNVSLAGRLARTRETLASPAWSRDRVASDLNEALGEWLAGQPL
jgi:hypothetical protein